MSTERQESIPERIGHYEIRGVAGRGAMAVVYEGYDPAEGRRVAVKVLHPDAAGDLSSEVAEEMIKRFEAEAEAASRIDNRHVIKIFEAGRDGDRRFIAMEFIEGTNLKELLELGTHFSLSDVSDIAIQVAEGLDAIHAEGIVHRDIKPANIVRTESGRLFITDFGIVKLSEDATLSREGSIVGTPNYMSPEQIKGSHEAKVGHLSDIFSLGVIVYELLARKKPFEGKEITQTMYNITHVHPASPLIYNPDLPRGVEQVIFRALAKNPGERFERASDFSTELARIEHDHRLKNITQGFKAPDTEHLGDYDPAAHPPVQAGDPGEGREHRQGITDAHGYSRAIDLGKPAFCVDCGMENTPEKEYCVRCGLLLLRREAFFDELKKAGKISRNTALPLIYTIINAIAVGVLILLLWLFLRSG